MIVRLVFRQGKNDRMISSVLDETISKELRVIADKRFNIVEGKVYQCQLQYIEEEKKERGMFVIFAKQLIYSVDIQNFGDRVFVSYKNNFQSSFVLNELLSYIPYEDTDYNLLSQKFWVFLEDLGVHEEIIEELEAMYTNCCASVYSDYKKSLKKSLEKKNFQEQENLNNEKVG